MGFERSFLQRLTEAGRSPRGRPSTSEDAEALVESVRENLTRLLNARHGMSEAQPDYGLPAMTDLTMSGGDYVQRVREAIRITVEKYEPRLRRVRVTVAHDESDLQRQTLVFRIEATLVGRSGEHRVWYETALTGSGEFDVAG